MKMYTVTWDVLNIELRNKYAVVTTDDLGIRVPDSICEIRNQDERYSAFVEWLNNKSRVEVKAKAKRASEVNNGKDLLLITHESLDNNRNFFYGPIICRWLGYDYEICTSYYEEIWKRTYDHTVVRISASAPEWTAQCSEKLPEVYPEWFLINGIKKGTISEEEYTKKYLLDLSEINKSKIDAELFNFYVKNGCKKLALCCWCFKKKVFFCHRRLLVKFIRPDIDIPELEEQ